MDRSNSENILSGSGSACDRRWQEKNGVVYFSVTSHRMDYNGWIKDFRDRNLYISFDAKDILSLPGFEPTNGITTTVAILKSGPVASGYFTSEQVCRSAREKDLIEPGIEIAH